MNAANYNKYLNFMAKLESVATPKEKELINKARGMFAKFEAGTAATMDVKIPNGTSSDLGQHTFGSAGNTKVRHRTDEERAQEAADREAREKQWAKQGKALERKATTAKQTLLKYAELKPAELDVWVEKVLEPAIEDYLNTEEGGLEWGTDEKGKKVVNRVKGAGGFVTPEIKRAKFKEDRKLALKEFRDAKKAEKKDLEDALNDEETKPAANKEEKKVEEKKPGFFSKIKKFFGESVTDAECRSLYESVFGSSEHLSDEAVRAICYNAVDRLSR